jgi:hypothetical protein
VPNDQLKEGGRGAVRLGHDTSHATQAYSLSLSLSLSLSSSYTVRSILTCHAPRSTRALVLDLGHGTLLYPVHLSWQSIARGGVHRASAVGGWASPATSSHQLRHRCKAPHTYILLKINKSNPIQSNPTSHHIIPLAAHIIPLTSRRSSGVHPAKWFSFMVKLTSLRALWASTYI